ncbi:MAG: hypothetical protein JJT96_02935 [Opitutales bacterium]|nr:hypothetical protein [Opitutales bacterium]
MILRRLAFLVLGALFVEGARADLIGQNRDVDATFLLSAGDRQLPAHGALLSGVRAAAADSGEWLATPIRIVDVSVRGAGGAVQAGALRAALADGADGLIMRVPADFPWRSFDAVFRAMDLPIVLTGEPAGSGAGGAPDGALHIGDAVFERALAEHFAGDSAEERVVVVGAAGHAWTRWLIAAAEAAGRTVVFVGAGEALPDSPGEVWWVDPPLSEAPHLRGRSGKAGTTRVFVVACHPGWISGLREGRIDQLWQPSPFDWGYASVVRLRATQGDTRLGEIAPDSAPVRFSRATGDLTMLEALWARWLQ